MSHLSVPIANWLITSLSAKKRYRWKLIPTFFGTWRRAFPDLQPYFQDTRHNIQEPSRSCRALVIHLEIGHCSIIYMKDLNVLAADINDSVDIWKQKSCALGMAGKVRSSVYRQYHPSKRYGHSRLPAYMPCLPSSCLPHLARSSIARCGPLVPAPTSISDLPQSLCHLFKTMHLEAVEPTSIPKV